MKMKEFGPQGLGVRVPGAPLDPPMVLFLDTSIGYEWNFEALRLYV